MNKAFFFLLTLTFFSCSRQPLPEFDYETWKSDENACTEKRMQLLDSFNQNVKDFLLKKSQKEVVKILGKPDIIELNKRHTKTFIFFIEPNYRKCSSENTKSKAVCIEFNSLGVVSVVSEQIR